MSKQRGRPKGASSTVRVKLKDLMRFITTEGTVMVGTTWLEEIGLGIKKTETVTLNLVKETPENTKISSKALV